MYQQIYIPHMEFDQLDNVAQLILSSWKNPGNIFTVKKIPLVSMPCLFYGHSAHFALSIQRGIRRLVFWGGGEGGGGDAQKNSQDRKEVQWEGGGSFVVWNVIG
jgi:hypothetical protein